MAGQADEKEDALQEVGLYVSSEAGLLQPMRSTCAMGDVQLREAMDYQLNAPAPVLFRVEEIE